MLYKNYPPNLTMADYGEAINLFCQENSHARAIYLTGSINSPGISDIDFLIVGSKPKINPRVKEYQVGGNVLIMPEHLVKYTKYLLRINMQQIWGEKLDIEENRNESFDAINIIEWLPERIMLLEHLGSKNVYDVRRILLYLKSIDLSISNVEKHLRITLPRTSIETVRSNYRNLNLAEVLLDYIKTAYQAWEMFQEVNLFDGDVSGRVALSEHYTFTNRFPLLMQYLQYLTSFESKFTQRLKQFLHLKGSVSCKNQELEHLIIFRANLMDELYQWFIEKGLKNGMIKFGWILKG